MPEYLGLGLTFYAMDKGFTDTLKDAVKGLQDTDQTVDKLGKKTNPKEKGSLWDNFKEGLQLLSISKIGSGLDDLSSSLLGNQHIASNFYQVLEKTNAKLGQVFDPTEAKQFQAAVNGSIGAMNAQEVNAMATGFLKFGRSAKEAAEVMPMMGKMIGIMGMDAGHVAKMFGEGLAFLKATPAEMKDLMYETVRMQKAYNLTDQLENLPEIFEVVTKNAAHFGEIQTGAAMKSVLSVQKLSMAFQKMGLSQDKAVHSAVSFTDKLGKMQQSILDMQVGLEPLDDSIFDLQESLVMMGKLSPEDAMNMIQDGFKDSAGLKDQMTKMLGGMDDSSKLFVTQRLRRVFGDDITNLVSTYSDGVNKAIDKAEQAKEKLPPGKKEFDNLTKALGGTIEVMQKFADNAKEMFDAKVLNKNRDYVNKFFKNQIEGWKLLGEEMDDPTSMLGQFVSYLSVFKTMGISAFFDDATVAKWGHFFKIASALLFPLLALAGAFKLLLIPFQLLWNVFGFILPSFKTLAKVGSFLEPLFTKLAKGVRFLGGVLGRLLLSPLRWGITLFAEFGSAVMAAAGTIGTFLLGALEAVAAFFAGPIGIAILAVVALGAAIWGIVSYWDEIKAGAEIAFKWMTENSAKFIQYLSDSWTTMSEFLKSTFLGVVNFIGGAIDAFRTGGWDGFVAYISNSWKQLMDFGQQKFTAFRDAAIGIIASMLVSISGYIKAFQDKGFAGLFDKMLQDAKDAALKMKDTFLDIFKGIGTSISDSIGSAVNAMKSGLDSASGLLNKINPFSSGNDIGKPDTGNKTPAETAAGSLAPKPAGTAQTDTDQKLKPVADQPGAPKRAQTPGQVQYMDKGSSIDKNTQALIDEIFDMKRVMVELLQMVIDRPMKVNIKGDARKFFDAQSEQANNDAGSAGIGHVVNN